MSKDPRFNILRERVEVLFTESEQVQLGPLLEALFNDAMVGLDYLRGVLNIKVNWRRKIAALKAHTGIIDMQTMNFHEFYAAMLLGQPRKGDPEGSRNCALVRKLFHVYQQALRARYEQLELSEIRLGKQLYELRSREQLARGDHLRFLLAKRLNLALDERRTAEIRDLFVRMRTLGLGTTRFNLQLVQEQHKIDVFLVKGDGTEALTYISEVRGKKHVPLVEIKTK